MPELTKYLKCVMLHCLSDAWGDGQVATSQCKLLDAKGKPDYSLVGREEGGISAACFRWITFYQHTFSINQACRKNSNTGEGCKHQSLKFALEDMGTKIQDSVIYDEAHHETWYPCLR